VTPPGPTGLGWAVTLLLWAFSVAVVGELLRGLGSLRVSFWRTKEPIERGLLDLYLGGAVMYLVAALPLGAFGLPAVAAISVGATAVLVVRLGLARRRGAPSSAPDLLGRLVRPWTLVAIGSALGLFAVELVAALPVATGNTYDSSLLTTYVALLLQHGSVPISFRPYASAMILYPQGTTVWLAGAQTTFGLPPARTSLLVTPLFLALEPLAAFVFGRKLLGSDRGGACAAVVFAWLGPGTRDWVGGSNDFVLAAPLVLLLASEVVGWIGPAVPSWGDAAGFGVLVGYSAAINPVGAEWLLPAVLLAAALGRPGLWETPLRWLSRWGAAIATSLVGVSPSLYVLARGLRSPGFIPGAPASLGSAPTGISVAQFFGSIDPFLFRPGDIELSPIPLVRLELAILLVLGVVALIVAVPSASLGPRLDRFRRWSLGAGIAIVGWLALLAASAPAGSPVRAVSYVTNGSELSACLFLVFAFVAAVPLLACLDRLRDLLAAPASPSGSPRRTGGRALAPSRVLVPLALALVIVVPGVVLTPTQLTPVLSELYTDFGNVSAADFALLEWAGSHLPAGSRVLVAPGSAAEFLPGYARDLVLLYPMEPGGTAVNASYAILVEELTNGTLDPAGNASLAALDVQFIAVTGANTILWPPFSPAPLLLYPTTFPLDFHEADAYVFART
jgi:hypothetical protein